MPKTLSKHQSNRFANPTAPRKPPCTNLRLHLLYIYTHTHTHGHARTCSWSNPKAGVIRRDADEPKPRALPLSPCTAQRILKYLLTPLVCIFISKRCTRARFVCESIMNSRGGFFVAAPAHDNRSANMGIVTLVEDAPCIIGVIILFVAYIAARRRRRVTLNSEFQRRRR